ncbi:transposase [Streptomyces sp. R39]|uniref:Transposase n=1 Tax=Streptomyces sp. R39 TaxID=3238631 RepID=A0AB39R596_9ACTN
MEWELLAPLVPRAKPGRRRVEDRRVINGMVDKVRTGISCRHLPERQRIPLACDGRGGPPADLLTAGRRHDGVCARPLVERIGVPGSGRGSTSFLAHHRRHTRCRRLLVRGRRRDVDERGRKTDMAKLRHEGVSRAVRLPPAHHRGSPPGPG